MPEYLAPGVFVEEVSFRSKSIEGVATSTTGYAGVTGYGPVYYPGGPRNCEPRLITSFTEYERVYGRLADLVLGGNQKSCFMALSTKAFFDNGGKRLYVSRVFERPGGGDPAEYGIARIAFPAADITATWRARWPGRMGNVRVRNTITRSRNVAFIDSVHGIQARSARVGAVVEIVPAADIANPPVGNAPLNASNLRVVRRGASGQQEFIQSDGTVAAPNAADHLQIVELTVSVDVDDERTDEFTQLSTSPEQKRYIGRVLELDDPEDENSTVWFSWDPSSSAQSQAFMPAQLMVSLQASNDLWLVDGLDGDQPTADSLLGDEANPDVATEKATGLRALGEIDDIAIVALPDGGTEDTSYAQQAADRLISHAEEERYRIAVIDAPAGSSMNEIRAFRAQFDSTRAALYHPWVEILDPLERASQGVPPRKLMVPPSGFVTGIYARNDITRGVHKAPANEVVRGLTKFEANINTPRQEVLNPEGINALRFFEGRGHRVWGARTISSDPEWKYVNVRRLFIFIEHSIDKSTQWAVFEPNNQRLWDNIRRAIEDFLLVLWTNGALMGDKPEKAFFVRCDRSTMTQNDIDNGRMICQVGIAPVKPAEFVIFRVGQWTADASNN